MAAATEFTSRQEQSIVTRYKAGESSIRIAERLGVTPNVVLRVLRANGVKVRGRGRYPSA